MASWFAFLSALILFGMALLQLSLTFGAPFGEYVLGGQYKVLPHKMRFMSLGYTILFILVGLVYLQKGRFLSLGFSSVAVQIILIIMTAFYGYAIIGNGFLTKSKKEKYVMTPFSAVQFILSLLTLIFL